MTFIMYMLYAITALFYINNKPRLGSVAHEFTLVLRHATHAVTTCTYKYSEFQL